MKIHQILLLLLPIILQSCQANFPCTQDRFLKIKEFLYSENILYGKGNVKITNEMLSITSTHPLESINATLSIVSTNEIFRGASKQIFTSYHFLLIEHQGYNQNGVVHCIPTSTLRASYALNGCEYPFFKSTPLIFSDVEIFINSIGTIDKADIFTALKTIYLYYLSLSSQFAVEDIRGSLIEYGTPFSVRNYLKCGYDSLSPRNALIQLYIETKHESPEAFIVYRENARFDVLDLIDIYAPMRSCLGEANSKKGQIAKRYYRIEYSFLDIYNYCPDGPCCR